MITPLDIVGLNQVFSVGSLVKAWNSALIFELLYNVKV